MNLEKLLFFILLLSVDLLAYNQETLNNEMELLQREAFKDPIESTSSALNNNEANTKIRSRVVKTSKNSNQIVDLENKYFNSGQYLDSVKTQNAGIEKDDTKIKKLRKRSR